jgi:hypothetical protein
MKLRIWHPAMDPAEITAALGLQPGRTMRAGERRMTPKGQLLDGLYAESYWSADPYQRGEWQSTDDTIEDLVAENLGLLEPHRAFLARVRDEGGRIHLQVSSYSPRNYTLELPPELLLRCGGLGLSFVHDVYPAARL